MYNRLSWHLFIILAFIVVQAPTYHRSINQETEWSRFSGPVLPGGKIIQINIDPSNPNHVFALQQQIGDKQTLLESSDSASNWFSKATFEGVSLQSIEIDVGNPDVLYVGSEKGIYRSKDAGYTWHKVSSFGPVIEAPAPNMVYSIISDYQDPTCLGGYRYFGFSEDQGETWGKTPLGCFIIEDLVSSPSQPDLIYARAAVSINDQYLLKSDDGGKTWMTIELSGPFFNMGLFPLAVDPENSKKLFTSTGTGIIVSQDGGRSWSSALETSNIGSYQFAFNNGIVYAGFTDHTENKKSVIYRSNDKGQTWHRLYQNFPDLLLSLVTHNSKKEFLYVGLEGHGIFMSIDGGLTWEEKNKGIESCTSTTQLVASQSDPIHLYAVVDWPYPAFFHFIENENKWTKPLPITDVISVAVDPQNPEVVWVINRSGLFVSHNGGESWKLEVNGSLTDIDISKDSPERPCATGDENGKGFIICRNKKDQKGATLWEKYFIPTSQTVTHLAISPTQSEWILVSGNPSNSHSSSLFISIDGGKTWSEKLEGPDNYFVMDIALSAGNPAQVIAAFGQGFIDDILVYQSTDSGEHWKDITAEIEDVAGELWSGSTYRASLTFDNKGVAFFSTRNVVLMQSGNKQDWIKFDSLDDLVYSIVLLPGSSRWLIVVGEQFLWKSMFPGNLFFWLPIIQNLSSF